jgi:hypothetical protein
MSLSNVITFETGLFFASASSKVSPETAVSWDASAYCAKTMQMTALQAFIFAVGLGYYSEQIRQTTMKA